MTYKDKRRIFFYINIVLSIFAVVLSILSYRKFGYLISNATYLDVICISNNVVFVMLK